MVFGETMSASQPLVERSARSEICLSSLLSASTTVKSPISGCSFTSAFIVVSPVTRHGLDSPALEKQRCHFFPGLAYFAVSTMDGWIICSHGVAESPCAVWLRWAICRSKSAWLKNFDCPAAADVAAPLGCAPAFGLVELHAAAASAVATSTASVAVARLVMDVPAFPSLIGAPGTRCRRRPR